MPAPTRPQMTASLTKQPHFAWMFPVGGFIHGVIDTDHVFWELNTSPTRCSFWGNPDARSREAGGLWARAAPPFCPLGPGSRPRAASKLFTAAPTAGLPTHTQTPLPRLARGR